MKIIEQNLSGGRRVFANGGADERSLGAMEVTACALCVLRGGCGSPDCFERCSARR